MKQCILMLIIALIGISCSKTEPTAATEELKATDREATTIDGALADLVCREGEYGVTPINIHLAAGEIRVDPPRAEACVGWKVQFNVPANAESIVHVKGKEEDDLWIDGNSTRGAGKFYIRVPQDLVPKNTQKDFEYFVFVPGIGNLDPVIIIKR